MHLPFSKFWSANGQLGTVLKWRWHLILSRIHYYCSQLTVEKTPSKLFIDISLKNTKILDFIGFFFGFKLVVLAFATTYLTPELDWIKIGPNVKKQQINSPADILFFWELYGFYKWILLCFEHSPLIMNATYQIWTKKIVSPILIAWSIIAATSQ